MKLEERQLRLLIQECLLEYGTHMGGEPIMGKYAWPSDRSKGDLPDDAKKEKDTAIEIELADAIRAHMSSNVPLKKKQAETLWSLIEKGMYKDILKAYTKGPVYRGMNVSRKWFEEGWGPLPDKPSKLNLKAQFRGWVEIPLKRKTSVSPIGWSKLESGDDDTIATSWTPDFKTTVMYMNSAMGSKSKFSTPIIFEADASDPTNRFLDLDPMYNDNFMGLSSLKNSDNEVIGLGNITPVKAYWYFSRHKDDAESGSDAEFSEFLKSKVSKRKGGDRGD
jgi:hypothetical protein